MSVTAPDLCSALFQVRAAWPRLIQSLPMEQVLAADFTAWTAAAPDVSARLQSVLRLFDGRRRLIDVLDDSEVPDPEACRFVSELLARQLLIPCEPPPEVNSHWDAPNAAPEVFFQAPAPDAETPVGWARSALTPVPGPLPDAPPDPVAAPVTAPVAARRSSAPAPEPMDRTITSESPVADPRGLVFGELVEASRAAARKRELSDTGTRLGWAALAAGGTPFDSTASEILNVASETRLAVRSTMPATPSILIADPQGLGLRETTTTLDQPPDQPHTETPTPLRRPRLRSVPNTPAVRPSEAASAGETTDPMLRITSQALDPPPSVRSHSAQWTAEAPPRRRALALASVGAVLGMAGSLLLWMRLGGPPEPERTCGSGAGPGGDGGGARGGGNRSGPGAGGKRSGRPPGRRPHPSPPRPLSLRPPPPRWRIAAAPMHATGTRASCGCAGRHWPRRRAARRRATWRWRWRWWPTPSWIAATTAGRAAGRARPWRSIRACPRRMPTSGFVEDQEGRRDEAMTAYRSYLRLAPDGRYANDIRTIVEAAP